MNFRKYAQYEELQVLYRKCLPAISSFEDKLKEANDRNTRTDAMLRRMDEVLCKKADKTALREFRDFSDQSFETKDDAKVIKGAVDDKITDFSKRVVEVEEMVKFSTR